MRHIINILVILLLVAMCVGIAYLIEIDIPSSSGAPSLWGIAYIPLIIMMGLWGFHLHNQYRE